MYRKALEHLQKWKENPDKKPLIIRGARRVGKTWLMKEFADKAGGEAVYINFEDNPKIGHLFSENFDAKSIIRSLELLEGRKIDPAKTILIFDEIQEIPEALTSLKYFNEDTEKYQILCGSSVPGTSFSSGDVELFDLYPLSFSEFLIAMKREDLAELIKTGSFEKMEESKRFYINMLKYYYFVGGMPEAVASFSENENFSEVREIQERILAAYEMDFSVKGPGEAIQKIRALWNIIPAQLNKENKKFMYGHMKEGARAKDYEQALLWLKDQGLIHKVGRGVSERGSSVIEYMDLRAFKVFLLDVGLLSCMSRLRQDVLMEGNAVFKEFNEALTMQYVSQQLKTFKGINTFYWMSEKGGAEIDFLTYDGNDIVPIEVKAEINLQAKSMKTYRERFRPAISIRTTVADHKKGGGLIDLPLYAIEGVGFCTKDA